MLFLIRRERQEIKKGTILLIRLDAIGDYVMFRNFIYVLKENKKYKDHSITLCGNIAWKDLAENLDKDIISDFIWIERLKFLDDPKYKYTVLKDIHSRGFEVAIDTIHSREILFGDAIIAASGSRERIGTAITEKFHKLKKGIFSDHFYTHLIPSSGGIMFEFNRTKEFFSKLLGEDVKISKPEIDRNKLKLSLKPGDKYIILFPGASREEKMWGVENFRILAGYILKNTNYKAVTAGSEKEKELCERVRPDNSSKQFINLSGGTLTELAGIISGASLLISNDTSAIHFAAAVNVPFICIANGFYYGRFYPYPEEIYNKGYFLYPKDFTPGKNGNLSSVSSEEVIFLMNSILN